MKFRFNIFLSDDDYLEYNIFHLLRSPYGKKSLKTLRGSLVLLVGAFILLAFVKAGFSLATFVVTIPLIILLILVQVFFSKYMTFSMKGQVKLLKKSGKMAYSPFAVMEFYDDFFVETTEDNKTEQKYSSIERISVVDNKTVYIHINNIMAYILPIASLDSMEQLQEFLEFMKTKCDNVDVYQSK